MHVWKVFIRRPSGYVVERQVRERNPDDAIHRLSQTSDFFPDCDRVVRCVAKKECGGK